MVRSSHNLTLFDRIIKGDLAPGDRIKELTVAKEFGTSQAPVREAIRCIETLGYADHVPHVGAIKWHTPGSLFWTTEYSLMTKGN